MQIRTYYASNLYLADGVTTTWLFSFAGVKEDANSGTTPYLYPEDVKVEEMVVNGDVVSIVERSGTLTAPNVIRVTGAPVAVGNYVRIFRSTEKRFPLVDYRDKQAVSENELDLANRQAIFLAQEAHDVARGSMADGELSRLMFLAQDAAERAEAIAAQFGDMATAVARAEAAAATATTSASVATAAAQSLSGLFAPPYNAKGDGVTDDTAAVLAFERDFKGQVVNLLNRTVVCSVRPRKNAYYNGRFKVGGYTRAAMLSDTFVNQPGRFSVYGGSICRLREALMDPFRQHLGIVFIGDSITWGSGSQENLPFDPRNGTLKDPRDTWLTDTYVNIFKRYIQKEFMHGVAPILSNFEFSTQGESIATFVREQVMVPDGPGFTVVTNGTGAVWDKVTAPSVQSRWQYRMTSQNEAVPTVGSIKWRMTGYKFTLNLSCLSPQNMDYQVLVDGVSLGQFSTTPGSPADNGAVFIENTSNNRRTHVLGGYRDNSEVEIRAIRRTDQGTTQVLRINALLFDKTVRVSNQGINGASVFSYNAYNLGPSAPSFSGKGAIDADDSFAFIQLGTNDRGGDTRYPITPTTFEAQYALLLENIPAGVEPILMVSNPAVDPAANLMKQSDIRASTHRVAQRYGLDFIDNYAASVQADVDALSNDSLHPKQEGFAVIARNIISSLEAAHNPFIQQVPLPKPVQWIFTGDRARILFSKLGTGSVTDTSRVASAALLGQQNLVVTGDTSGATNPVLKFKVENTSRVIVVWSGFPTAGDFELLFNGQSQGNTLTATPTSQYSTRKSFAIPEAMLGAAVQVEIRGLKPAAWVSGNIAIYHEAIGIDRDGILSAP